MIGGLAVQRWGEPRQTRDVDLTLLTGLGGEERFIDPILANYAGRLPEARQFAVERRVLLVETREGVPVDIALGGLPFEARAIARSTSFEFEPGAVVMTCSAGDSLRAEKPRPRSDGHLAPGLYRRFDRHPDGERVVAGVAGEGDARRDKVVFVFNFLQDLRRLAPPQP